VKLSGSKDEKNLIWVPRPSPVLAREGVFSTSRTTLTFHYGVLFGMIFLTITDKYRNY